MQSLVSLSYLPDTMLCLSFSFSAAVAAAADSSSSSLHCIQLQLLWRLLFVLHFLLCSSQSLSRSLPLHTHFFALCLFCAFFVFFVFFFYSFLMHTRRIGCFSFCLSGLSFAPLLLLLLCAFSLLFFLIYFALSLRSFVLLRWISTCQTSMKRVRVRVCVCRNATGEGEAERWEGIAIRLVAVLCCIFLLLQFLTGWA